MTIRTTLTDTTRKARMSTARATIREFDDDHLMQQVKSADVTHSETPTDFERWQGVGMTAFPIKQQPDPNQKKPAQPSNTSEEGDWNHDQPTGPAAEAVMLYLGGSRSHPVAMVDDRRVRPYGMSEGEGAHYAPDGSEQMVLFKNNGTYITSLDGTSVQDSKTKQTRMVSLRHVNKKMQTHKIEKSQSSSGGSSGGGSAGAQATQQDASGGSSSSSGNQQQEKYKHEGDSVNTEVRCTASHVEIYSGDKLVGLYDKGSDTWTINESGGNFKLIISPSHVIGQYQDTTKSFMVDKTHTHIKYGGNSIFVDAGGCWSTVPIQVKGDPA
jgi:phage gp45-like